MEIFHTRLAIYAKLLLCFSIFLIPLQSHASDVSFQWTATQEPFTGYKIYYKVGGDSTLPYEGIGLDEGISPLLIGKVNTYTVSGLSPDNTYHFVITAYNDENESDYSAIVTIGPSTRPVIHRIYLK